MRRALLRLPKNDATDYLYSLAKFVRIHRRLPRRDSLLFNDVLFALRNGPEITHPDRVRISDKELVKDFVRERIGQAYVVPTLAVLRSAEDVDSYEFPRVCVAKPTHMSGHFILRKDGEAIDRDKVQSWLGLNYYDTSRERNYRSLVPKIMVEQFALGRPSVNIYRLYCVNGGPRMVHVNVDFLGADLKSYYDGNWNLLPFWVRSPRPANVPRPACWEEMLDVAARLSRGFSILRVDLYSDGKRIVVGELTNCSGGSFEPFNPFEGEVIASRLLWPERGSKLARRSDAV